MLGINGLLETKSSEGSSLLSLNKRNRTCKTGGNKNYESKSFAFPLDYVQT